MERNNGIRVKNPSEVYILYDKIINNSLKYNDCEIFMEFTNQS